jgi:hypothetical protein
MAMVRSFEALSEGPMMMMMCNNLLGISDIKSELTEVEFDLKTICSQAQYADPSVTVGV